MSLPLKAATAVIATATMAAAQTSETEVLETYADIAEAVYSDGLRTAENLEQRLAELVEAPSADTA